MHEIDVTKREILVSCIILCVLLTIGLFISGGISEHTMAKNEAIISAVQINTPSTFAHGLRTNIGDALVYGTLEADTPVSFPELAGEFLAASKVREEYTMHTETYTETDSDGNAHTRTRVYWSWDYWGAESVEAETVLFLDHSFSFDSFAMNNTQRLRLSMGELSVTCPYQLRGNYLYRDSDTRYYYNVVPVSFAGTVNASLQDNAFANRAIVYPGQQPDEVIEDCLKHQNTPNIIFWCAWVLLMSGAIIGFCYLDNWWLETSKA